MSKSGKIKLQGRLVAPPSRYHAEKHWLKLEVPQALAHGLYAGLQCKGARPNPDTAHIPVMFEDEAEKVGIDNIVERGEFFTFTLGAIKSVRPTLRKEYKKLWVIRCYSSELRKLRESYGLKPLPNGQEFHITFAVEPNNQKLQKKSAIDPELLKRILGFSAVGGGAGLLTDAIREFRERDKKEEEDKTFALRNALLGALAGGGAGGAYHLYDKWNTKPTESTGPTKALPKSKTLDTKQKSTKAPSSKPPSPAKEEIDWAPTEEWTRGRLRATFASLNTTRESMRSSVPSDHIPTNEELRDFVERNVDTLLTEPKDGSITDLVTKFMQAKALGYDQAEAIQHTHGDHLFGTDTNGIVSWSSIASDPNIEAESIEEGLKLPSLASPEGIGFAGGMGGLGGVGNAIQKAIRNRSPRGFLRNFRRGALPFGSTMAGAMVGQEGVEAAMDAAGVEPDEMAYDLPAGVSWLPDNISKRQLGRLLGDYMGGDIGYAISHAIQNRTLNPGVGTIGRAGKGILVNLAAGGTQNLGRMLGEYSETGQFDDYLGHVDDIWDQAARSNVYRDMLKPYINPDDFMAQLASAPFEEQQAIDTLTRVQPENPLEELSLWDRMTGGAAKGWENIDRATASPWEKYTYGPYVAARGFTRPLIEAGLERGGEQIENAVGQGSRAAGNMLNRAGVGYQIPRNSIPGF